MNCSVVADVLGMRAVFAPSTEVASPLLHGLDSLLPFRNMHEGLWPWNKRCNDKN